MRVGCNHGRAYIEIIYDIPKPKAVAKTATKEPKYAGIDPGFKLLASLFVDDEMTPSICVSGAEILAKNVEFNTQLAEATSKKYLLRNAEKEFFDAEKDRLGRRATPEELQAVPGYSEAKAKLVAADRYLSSIYTKRHALMLDTCHKAAKKLVEFAAANGVTNLGLPKNLGDWFQQPSYWKPHQNAKFRKIPVMRLMHYVEYLAEERGIKVVWVDESYSSKTSAISNNIMQIHEESKKENIVFEASRDVLQGVRRDRSFIDDTHGMIHADVAGAANISTLTRGTPTLWTKAKIDKLRSPIILRGAKLRKFFSLPSAAFSAVTPEQVAPFA
jgi:IS605 OrfB family transposase